MGRQGIPGDACPCWQLALPEERREVWSEQVSRTCMPGCNPELSGEGREAIWAQVTGFCQQFKRSLLGQDGDSVERGLATTENSL